MRLPVSIALAVATAACDPSSADHSADEPETMWTAPQLVLHNGDWSPVTDAALDPFPEHAPATVNCTRAATTQDYDALELDTAECNYFALQAPLLLAVTAGDMLTVRAFHDDLAAAEPAIAHLALAIDGHVIWDQEVDIPAPATPYTIDIAANLEAEAGASAVLHLHNHGLNTYRLLDVRVRHPQ